MRNFESIKSIRKKCERVENVKHQVYLYRCLLFPSLSLDSLLVTYSMKSILMIEDGKKGMLVIENAVLI